jgi:multidrug efflux pump subunit AcrB
MMTTLFDYITRLSLRLRWITIGITLIILAAGVWAMTQLNQELLPRVEFPQTVVVVQWPDGESAEQFLEEITIPLENRLSAVSGVVNVESTTNPSFAFIIVRNDFGMNQAAVFAELETAAQTLPLPPEATVQLLNFSLSDLPVVVASVSSDELSLPELKALVEAELQPRLEELEQVSRIAISGGQELPDQEPERLAEALPAPPDPSPTPTLAPTPTAEPIPTAEPEPEPTAVAAADEAVAAADEAVAAADEATEAEPLPEFEPIPLPQSWVAGAAQMGQTISSTGDITPSFMRGILSFAPEQLADLSPAMWRAINPEAVALALPVVGETVTPTLLLELEAIQLAAAGTDPDPVPLPDSWLNLTAGAGFPITSTAALPPQALSQIVEAAPNLLNDLTPELLLALRPALLAVLPGDYLATLDDGLQQTITNVQIAAARHELLTAVAPDNGAVAGEGLTVDPARLPDMLIETAASFGVELAYAQDIQPDFARALVDFGPQGWQILAILTPDNLRFLQPEVIALLPQDFLEELDTDLRADLDELAAGYGGAGQLALQEAAEREAAAADAPPLGEIWTRPRPDGSPSPWQTAADILNNRFAPSAAAFINVLPESSQEPVASISSFSPEVMQYLAENEAGFVENLSPIVLEMLAPETLTFLLDTYPEAFEVELAERLRQVAAGDVEVFVPTASITRANGDPSVIVSLFKDGDANTVVVAHRIFDEMAAFRADYPSITTNLVFEQATFIEESIAGVSREGALGAVFATLIILLFLSGQVSGKYRFSWRATMVTAVSIPLSIFSALLMMWLVPLTLGSWLQTLIETYDNTVLLFISRLFPTDITLNIMTLSGLTVAIGRVVDDSIVILENSYRYIQQGEDPKVAVIKGTREVAVAIFTATATTMAVFLPLGLIGGIVGSFFMPFGLTVAYALAGSFLTAITVVPTLTYLLIDRENIPEARETTMQRWYTPSLAWALRHRGATMAIATLVFVASLFLMTRLPQSFIPAIGEPTVNVRLDLPGGTTMLETDTAVQTLEAALRQFDGIETVQTEIGSGGGFAAIFGGGGIQQNRANLTITAQDQDSLSDLTGRVRHTAESLFGADSVTVSAASQTGFSGFSLILTGDSLAELLPAVPEVKAALAAVDVDGDGTPDIANVSSNVDDLAAGNGDTAIIRVDGRSAISFSGELETDNTLGVTETAKQAIANLDSLPPGTVISEGFESQQQVEGFRSMLTAITYAILIAYFFMALSFRSFIHPFTILFSLPFALVGAVTALYITDSVLGISAMIGLMMLVGLVVTNGIVLIKLVQQLREQGMATYAALVEAGRIRLRPIWMTALTAILALTPLAVSGEAGAIIASELARAVMGGLLVSTALTLIVVPVVYSLFDQLVNWLRQTLPVAR